MTTKNDFATFVNIDITTTNLADAGIDLDEHADYFFDEYLRENLTEHPTFHSLLLELHEEWREELQNAAYS